MPELIRKPQITAQDNYFWLFISMLVLFFCSALFDQLGSVRLSGLSGGLLAMIILVAVWSMERGKHPLFSRTGISILLLAVIFLEYIFQHHFFAILQLVTLFIFTLSTISIACRQVLLSGSVDSNKIIGAICIYMLMAIAWALAYLLVEQIFPGSIAALDGEHWHQNLQRAIYYSFVTITTLGFGDVTPLQPLASYLTYLEAVTGQFYIAILVASLIGVRFAAKQA